MIGDLHMRAKDNYRVPAPTNRGLPCAYARANTPQAKVRANSLSRRRRRAKYADRTLIFARVSSCADAGTISPRTQNAQGQALYARDRTKFIPSLQRTLDYRVGFFLHCPV
jgi:hypothetical protein